MTGLYSFYMLLISNFQKDFFLARSLRYESLLSSINLELRLKKLVSSANLDSLIKCGMNLIKI